MSPLPKVSFLLVDDKEENLLALSALLRRDDLELVCARSGREALELLLTRDFGLAILDVQMPEMDGFELAELMRGTLRTRHIPIIFLTADGFNKARRFRGYEAGAVDFLFKPVEPIVLKGKADVFCDLYRQRRELEAQRDELQAAMDENARLYAQLLELNGSLEDRVEERTRQLLEANEQLQGFTYSIAHDFRQHIRNINVNAQMILMEGGEEVEPWRTNLERVSHVAKLMSRMTEDLLAHARARTMKLTRDEVNVSELADEIGSSYRASFPRTRLEIEPGLRAFADRTLLRIVLENLIDNAFKYSQQANAPVVEVGREPGGFYVRDNGIGIDLAYADKLFMPFQRLSRDPEFIGTGMGLANVKRIVDRHQGCVKVTSPGPGRGATFAVRLEPALPH